MNRSAKLRGGFAPLSTDQMQRYLRKYRDAGVLNGPAFEIGFGPVMAATFEELIELRSASKGLAEREPSVPTPGRFPHLPKRYRETAEIMADKTDLEVERIEEANRSVREQHEAFFGIGPKADKDWYVEPKPITELDRLEGRIERLEEEKPAKRLADLEGRALIAKSNIDSLVNRLASLVSRVCDVERRLPSVERHEAASAKAADRIAAMEKTVRAVSQLTDRIAALEIAVARLLRIAEEHGVVGLPTFKAETQGG